MGKKRKRPKGPEVEKTGEQPSDSKLSLQKIALILVILFFVISISYQCRMDSGG